MCIKYESPCILSVLVTGGRLCNNKHGTFFPYCSLRCNILKIMSFSTTISYQINTSDIEKKFLNGLQMHYADTEIIHGRGMKMFDMHGMAP